LAQPIQRFFELSKSEWKYLLRFVYFDENQKLPFKKEGLVRSNKHCYYTLLILRNFYFYNSCENNYEYVKATN